MGLAFGVGLALLRQLLDTKVRTEADIQKVTDESVIGSIGYDDDAPKHPLIVQSSPHSHRSEAFRRLQTNLQFLDVAGMPKTTVINLAITLAESGSDRDEGNDAIETILGTPPPRRPVAGPMRPSDDEVARGLRT